MGAGEYYGAHGFYLVELCCLRRILLVLITGNGPVFCKSGVL